MSVSKIWQRWLGATATPTPKKSEANEHIAKIEAELNAMRARLRTLESRADALYPESSTEQDTQPKDSENKSEPPAEKKPETAGTSDLAAQLSAELSAGTEKQPADIPEFTSVEDIAKIFPPTESVDEARKISEQHEINRAAQQLLMALNPDSMLDENSASSSSSMASSSSSSCSSSASSSAASSPPGSPKPAALDVSDLDALLKGVNTSDAPAPAETTDSSMDLMAALDSIGSIPGEKLDTPTKTNNDAADLMAALDSIGGSSNNAEKQSSTNEADSLASLASLNLPDLSSLDSLGDSSKQESSTAEVDALSSLASLGLPDLSALDNLGGAGSNTANADLASLGDLGDLGDLSSLNQISADLSALDALAGLDSLAGLDNAPAKPVERPLVLDHYEAEDTNIAGLRRGKKKPTLTARGVARFSMEDAHAAVFPFNHSTTQAFFGVFDGFSGRDCAQDATEAVPKALADNIKASGLSADLTAIWPKVFADADEALRKHEYVGCTCTSVFVWEFEGERYVQSANCGDSNVYLFRGDKAIMLNTEHKVTSAEERKRIQAMGIEMTPGQTRVNGVAVARALGVHFIKDENLGIVSTPSISAPYKLQSDDHFLVIASDGLWDVISGQDACEMVRDLPSASAMASTLLKHAVKSTKCVDNVTVVVIRL